MNPDYIPLRELRTLPIYKDNWRKAKACTGDTAAVFLKKLHVAIHSHDVRTNVQRARDNTETHKANSLHYVLYTSGHWSVNTEETGWTSGYLKAYMNKVHHYKMASTPKQAKKRELTILI